MGGRIKEARPPAAIAFVVMALVAALVGTAVAGTDATRSSIGKQRPIGKQKVKKIAKKQANRAIAAALPLGSDAIADGAVIAGKLADGAVGRSKVASRAIGPSALGDVVLRSDQERCPTAATRFPRRDASPANGCSRAGGPRTARSRPTS